MSVLTKLKSGYNKWKSEADARAERAMKQAETKREKDKIKAQLAIETAKRKKAVVEAQIEQKEAENALKQAKRKLKGESQFSKSLVSGFRTLESIANYGSTPKKKTTTTHHRKKTTAKRKTVARKRTTKPKSKSYEIIKRNGKYYRVYD